MRHKWDREKFKVRCKYCNTSEELFNIHLGYLVKQYGDIAPDMRVSELYTECSKKYPCLSEEEKAVCDIIE